MGPPENSKMDDSYNMPPTPEKEETQNIVKKEGRQDDDNLRKKSRKMIDRIEKEDPAYFPDPESSKSKNVQVITFNEVTEFRGLKDRKMLYEKYMARDEGYKFHMDAIKVLCDEFGENSRSSSKTRSRSNSTSKIVKNKETVSGSISPGNKRIRPSLRSRGEEEDSSSDEEIVKKRKSNDGSRVGSISRSRSEDREKVK